MTPALLARRYRLLRTLGAGAMGQVHLAHDTATGHEVALKVIAMPAGQGEKPVLQFKQEFQLMAQLRHPNCCAVHDFGVMEDGSPYFTMEVVPGRGLDERLPLPADEVREVLIQLLLALAYVHNLGFVHRDIKGANVRVRTDGVVKLMDYGLMEHAGRGGLPVGGTLGYLAPEAIARGPLDGRTDLYAVGCLAYELLTGELPFRAARPMELLRAHMSEPPRPPSRVRAGVPADLERIVLRLLEKEPVARFASASEVLEALSAEVPAGLGGSLLASPLVGRADELARLEAHLDRIAAGGPGAAVAIVGGAGTGKSRLIHALRVRAQLDGLIAAIGTARPRNRAPYGAIAEALTALLPAWRSHAPEALAVAAPVLVALVPGLADELPGLAPAPPLDSPGQEKSRLQAMVAEGLLALAARVPFALILEDWHAADALSAELLAHVLRTRGDAPMLVVTTERPRPEAPRAGDTESIALAPLDADGLQRMVGSMLGSADVPPELLRALAGHGEGNPRLVEELLEHLVRQGALRKGDGRWRLTTALGPAHFPADLAGALARKLDALPPGARAVARVAAVAGDGFTLALLRDAVALDEAALFGAVEALERQQILGADEWGFFAFEQEELRATLYEELAPAEQARLHAAVAARLEAGLDGAPLADVALGLVTAIADHLLRAEPTDRAIAFAVEAGRRHAKLFANADALRFLQAALAAIRLRPDAAAWDGFVLEALGALGDVHRVLGDAPAALAAYGEALPLAARLDEAAIGPLLTSRAKALQATGDLPGALEVCAEAMQRGLATDDLRGAARALLTSCRIHYFRGDPAEAIAHTARALRLAREDGDPGRLGEALAFLGYLFATTTPDRLDDGLAHLDEAVGLLGATGDKLGLNNALILRGNVQRALGDLTGARASFFEVQRIARAIDNQPEYVSALVNLAIVNAEAGDHPEALAACRHARPLAEATGIPYLRGAVALNEGLALVHAGRIGEGLRLLDDALADAQARANRYLEVFARQQRAEAALLLGRPADAAADLAALAGDGAPGSEQAARLDALGAETAWRMGERDRAAGLAARALEAAQAARAAAVEVRARKVQAWLALAAEGWDACRAAADAALALAARIGSRWQAAELQGLLGELALATADGDAHARFTAMGEAAEALDARHLRPLALFGQAAARPYAPDAAALAARARELQEALAVGLDAAGREAYLSHVERQRVAGGDWAAFGRPSPNRPATGPLPKLGMEPGRFGL